MRNAESNKIFVLESHKNIVIIFYLCYTIIYLVNKTLKNGDNYEKKSSKRWLWSYR